MILRVLSALRFSLHGFSCVFVFMLPAMFLSFKLLVMFLFLWHARSSKFSFILTKHKAKRAEKIVFYPRNIFYTHSLSMCKPALNVFYRSLLEPLMFFFVLFCFFNLSPVNPILKLFLFTLHYLL